MMMIIKFQGAVKVTPGHDHKDYEMGLRHGLEMLNIFDDAGNLVGVPDEFLVLHVFPDCCLFINF